MKIWLMDHYSNPPRDLGDARQFSNARELISRGHQVQVIASSFNHLSRAHYPYLPDGAWENMTFAGVPFTLIKSRAYKSNFEVPRVLNMFDFAWRAWGADWAKKLDPPDLILGSTPDPFVALAAERLSARYGVPFVLEIRDLWPYAIVEVTGHSKYHPFVQMVDWTMRYLYMRARRVIMLSRNSTELLVREGADRKKIVWIPQGVDLSMSPEPALPPDDGVFTVTYLGAHNEWNSLDIVLDAAKLLEDSGKKDILFRFVGDGVSKAALVERAKRDGIRNVRFDDPVGKEDIYKVHQSSDAFIINNRRDGVSKNWMSFNKLYDYLAGGRPVIFGSFTENDPVRESGGGISVEAGNPLALAEAVRSLSTKTREELLECGLRGRKLIKEQYSTQAVIDRFETMACEVTGLPAGSIDRVNSN